MMQATLDRCDTLVDAALELRRELISDRCADETAGVVEPLCSVSASNIVTGKRARRAASNYYLECQGLRTMLLQDVGDEFAPAVLDQDLEDAQVHSESEGDGESESESGSEGEVENESEARSGSEYDSESDYSYQDQDEEYEESRDAMDIDDDSAESEDDLEHDLRRLSVLEMDHEEFDEFCSSLDPYRWRKRPSETALTDYWNPYWH